jgi:Uma2 family endonuclease
MALTKPVGTWTYDDLFALPDDGKRYEIIAGELFDLPSPDLAHATAISNLIGILIPPVTRLGGLWRTGPLGVCFPDADPVLPDIIVLLPGGRAHPIERGVLGPPDLIIEVLSPSTRNHDLLTKRALYGQAGVREYWIVDPEARTLTMLTLDRDALHLAVTASGSELAVSPLLGALPFAVSDIFAGIDQ